MLTWTVAVRQTAMRAGRAVFDAGDGKYAGTVAEVM
jgi:hypothetical protein